MGRAVGYVCLVVGGIRRAREYEHQVGVFGTRRPNLLQTAVKTSTQRKPRQTKHGRRPNDDGPMNRLTDGGPINRKCH